MFENNDKQYKPGSKATSDILMVTNFLRDFISVIRLKICCYHGRFTAIKMAMPYLIGSSNYNSYITRHNLSV